MEENHYYPFGMKHKGYNTSQYGFVEVENGNDYYVNIAQLPPDTASLYKYKYNGKEWQDELGLNMTAMDFRQYDNAIGRFNSVDVLVELFPDNSPYSFSFNNPPLFADPTGLCPECIQNVKDPKENQVYNTSGGATYTYINGEWTRTDIANELEEVVINVDKDKEDDNESVGQPGALESMIPVWGSGRAAIDNFQNGNYWQGTFHTAMAISDLFLVKSIFTGVAKGGLRAFGKNYSNWGSYRKLYGETGFAQKGQHLHHWLLKRNGQKSGTGVAWKMKNQMWNLMPMRSPAFHTAIHGKGINAFNTLERAYYGSPVWFQTGIISTIGHSLLLRGIILEQQENESENESE